VCVLCCVCISLTRSHTHSLTQSINHRWLISSGRHPVYSMRLPSGFAMIGANVGLKEYMKLNQDFTNATKFLQDGNNSEIPITKRSYVLSHLT